MFTLMFIPFLYSCFLYEIPRFLLLFPFFGGAPFSHSLGMGTVVTQFLVLFHLVMSIYPPFLKDGFAGYRIHN